MLSEDYLNRFSGIGRLYGMAALSRLNQCKITVIGIGGVGSWIAEAGARSGVGRIHLIDLDDICVTNTNRQVHALRSTVGQAKVDVMKKRIQEINPECHVDFEETFISEENLKLLTTDNDCVFDAIDSVPAKSAVINHCYRAKIPIITIGGAGGKIHPHLIAIEDLARTFNDPLLAKTRNTLRRQFQFPRDPKKKFKIDAVFSSEQLRYPSSCGGVSFAKSSMTDGTRLDCAGGFGSISTVTASFGLFAMSRFLEKFLL